MSTPQTITAEVGAWLTEYSNLGPQDFTADKAKAVIEGLQYSAHDMTRSGWTLIGKATITLTLPGTDGLLSAEVDSLRAAQRREDAEHEQRRTERQRQIQQLLAIAA